MSKSSNAKQKRRKVQRRLKRFMSNLSKKGKKQKSSIKVKLSDREIWDTKMMEDLQKKRKTQCVVMGITYTKVMKLQKILRAKGIDCNVTAGGFNIYRNYKDPIVIGACKMFNTVAQPGVTRMIEDTLCRTR